MPRAIPEPLRRVMGLLPLAALLGLLAAVTVHQLVEIPTHLWFAFDIEIPLQAAQRWLHGQPPYLASAFVDPEASTQPFLYPPYVLPLVAPLLALPRSAVHVGWDLACLLAALAALEGLAVPRRWWPALLAWEPVAESIWSGNVQIILLAAFVLAFYQRQGSRPWQPAPRDLVSNGLGARSGILATVVGAIKASQVHAWLLVARRDLRGAAIGAAALIGLTLVTLPLTGLGLWFEWLGQAARASDPNWVSIGWPLSRYLPEPVTLGVTAASLAAAFLLPRRDAAAWVGLLIVIAAPSVHAYMWVFCLPAMLRVRRELAVIAAIGFSAYRPDFGWASLALVGVALLASYRWSPLGAPGRRGPVTAPSAP